VAGLTDSTVLLFFHDFERDSFVYGDRYVKRAVRPMLSRFRKKQSTSGFRVWFERLVLALRSEGCDVRTDDLRAARRSPDFPVGLVGYPAVLDGWDLPNPAVLGPGLFDHPEQAPHLMDDARFRTYLVTCGWMYDLFATHYPADRLGEWFAGIDLAAWPEGRPAAKDVDVLVYDKIRFDRSEMVEQLLDPALARLDSLGLRWQVLRYGSYNYQTFRGLLQRSRMMLFLCEHETQGMAYQEAMATNVPVLAWQPGWWCDPQRLNYVQSDVPTTTVPYFSPECGETFEDFPEFDRIIDGMLARLGSYQPREFVRRELSLAASARAYLKYYDALRA